MSPSPHSAQQVLKLEQDLGAKLFDRLGRSVRLAEAGRAFLPHARSILHQMEAARAGIEDQRTDVRGSVALSAPFPPSRRISSRAIPPHLQENTLKPDCASWRKLPRCWSKVCATSPSTSPSLPCPCGIRNLNCFRCGLNRFSLCCEQSCARCAEIHFTQRTSRRAVRDVARRSLLPRPEFRCLRAHA